MIYAFTRNVNVEKFLVEMCVKLDSDFIYCFMVFFFF